MYNTLPLQLGCLLFFFHAMQATSLTNSEIFGRIFSMGIMCTIIGVNINHCNVATLNDVASAISFAFLETVIFIEHYALLSKKVEQERYKKVKRTHS